MNNKYNSALGAYEKILKMDFQKIQSLSFEYQNSYFSKSAEPRDHQNQNQREISNPELC